MKFVFMKLKTEKLFQNHLFINQEKNHEKIIINRINSIFINKLISQENKYPNPEIVKTQVVEASAEDTWEIISKFTNLAELTPSFLHSVEVKGKVGEGCERKCVAPDGKNYYKEKITTFNEKEMYYRYQLTESMLPVKNMENSFKVVPLGKSKSLVIWTSGFEFIDNPNMPREKFNGFIDAALTEMLTNVNKEVSNL